MRKVMYRLRVECLEERALLSLAIFGLDQPSSVLNLSGTVAGLNIQQQGNGSLSTTYQGTVVADVDLDGGTITFFGADSGSVAAADISGNWQPQDHGGSGSAPANYGGMVNIPLSGPGFAAVRNLQVFATSDPLALTTSDGVTYQFPSTQVLNILAGVADFRAPIVGSGQRDLANNSAQNMASAPGTLVDNGDGTFSLTVPVSVRLQQDLGGAQAVLNVNGSIAGLGGFGASPVRAGGDRIEIAAALEVGFHARSADNTTVASVNLDSHQQATSRPGTADLGSAVATTRQDTSIARTREVISSEQLTAIDALAMEMLRNDRMAV
jgi:hypothetical protein